MKRLILFGGLVMQLLLFHSLYADPYGYGETAPIQFVVPDTLDGEPIAPDSIQIAIYYEMGTTAVVASTSMTQWNSKVGEYYYNFTTPDSSGTYNPRVNWGAQGKEYVLWLENIYVQDIFNAETDTISASLVNMDLFTLSDGSSVINNFHNDIDTTFVRNPSGDTILIIQAFHTGGTPGQAPDSVKSETP